MVTLIMLVGLPGSGKSTYAQAIQEEYKAKIFSSDDIRKELCGSTQNQDINELVFTTLHKRIRNSLNKGVNCIYDATNIHHTRRKSFLEMLSKVENCYKKCVIMATPLKQCLKNNSTRDRKIPESAIKKMYKKYDPPYFYEGWDKIEIKYWEDSKNLLGTPEDFIQKYYYFNQESPYHSLSLGSHCEKATKILDKLRGNREYIGIQSDYNTINNATMIHDCGKPEAKEYVADKTGKLRVHYYNHEHIGAYESMFYDCKDTLPVQLSTLIRWHMQPYFWERENNQKLHKKYKKLWGEDLYNKIMLLHQADKQAH